LKIAIVIVIVIVVCLHVHSVVPREFNSYGSRRGNDSVMLRAMFAHSRLNNKLTTKPGPHTLHVPSNSIVRDCFFICYFVINSLWPYA